MQKPNLFGLCRTAAEFATLHSNGELGIKLKTDIMTGLLFGLGTGEIIVIVLVIVLLFGAKKIPELMKGVGKGVKSFKEGMKESDDEVKDEN